MTIKQAFSSLQWDVKGTVYRPTFDINFMNCDGECDETQFTVSGSFKTAIKELTDFFSDFCKENGCRTTSVTSITLVDDN